MDDHGRRGGHAREKGDGGKTRAENKRRRYAIYYDIKDKTWIFIHGKRGDIVWDVVVTHCNNNIKTTYQTT